MQESDALPRGRISHEGRLHRIGISATVAMMADIANAFRRFLDISICVKQQGKVLRVTHRRGEPTLKIKDNFRY